MFRTVACSLAVVPDEGYLLALYFQEPEDVFNSGLCHLLVGGVSEVKLVADPHSLVLPLGIARVRVSEYTKQSSARISHQC